MNRKLIQFWNSSLEYYEIARKENTDYYDGQHPFHVKMIEAITPNSLVLDLGCGTGEPSQYISCHSTYVGTDISQLGLRIAQQSCPFASFISGDVARLPFEDQVFDYVISTYSLEHFMEPQSTLLEAIRVLKPGGNLILLSAALDNPLSVPPSIRFSSLSVAGFKMKLKTGGVIQTFDHYTNRFRYVFRQLKKQVKLYSLKSYYEFEGVSNPLVLTQGYEIDNDTVYIVSIREVVKFLEGYGLVIQEVHQNPVNRWPGSRFFEYFTSTLFIVAQKPDTLKG